MNTQLFVERDNSFASAVKADFASVREIAPPRETPPCKVARLANSSKFGEIAPLL
jgi:hypothetical protein